MRPRPGPALVIGGGLTALLLGVAALSQVWTPEPPTRIRIAMKLLPPIKAGLLGTDHYGRDVASLLMAGAWNSLAVAIPSVCLGAAIGAGLGCLAAALRGPAETVALRVGDVVFAFPAVLSAIMLGAVLGSGPPAAIVAIAVFNVPVFLRVTRAVALQVWTTDYVAAARALGRHPVAITATEVLPNIAGVLLVQLTIQLALAILTEAGLSYLGLGIRPPNPSWGRMLADAQTYLGAAPHLALAPGLAIALSVLGLNLLGDGLRDALDPRLAARR
ncbi:MAG: ABC transporter permease [Methylobacteriaceae bacterium]|nr:ABC transporter permease [Methylobacteriaceae bacterium]